MDADPWNWSVDDVLQFFRNDAANYIADMRHSRLPTMEPFLNALSENYVNGSTLLTAIDSVALRDDCGVPTLGARGAVMHCITKLRRKSSIYAMQHGLPAPQLSASLPETSSLSTQTAQESVNNSTGATREHVRPGKVQVQDDRGRKRRKLDSTQLQTVQPSNVPNTFDNSGAYLSNSRTSVDELFYGNTALGHEVGELEPTGDLMIVDSDRAAGCDDQNFQFTFQNKPRGESEFVFARVRHFLQAEPKYDLHRDGRAAIGILPYGDNIRHKSRSATVLQFQGTSREPIAIRENAAHLDGSKSRQVHSQSPSEWDFLTQKYSTADDVLLPVFGEDDKDLEGADDDATKTQPATSDDESDMAEEVDGEEGIGVDAAREIIEDEIKKLIEEWREKLPKLEQKKAWTVWKQTKRSRTVRQNLIDGAQKRIQYFDTRLEKMKDRLLESTWERERDLCKSCISLEMTVRDREEERWKISVWKRTQEPAHVPRPSKHSTKSAQPSSASQVRQSGLYIPVGDRFSVLPAPTPENEDEDTPSAVIEDESMHEASSNEPNQANVVTEEEILYDADSEEYHTPEDNPASSPPLDLGAMLSSDKTNFETNGVSGADSIDESTNDNVLTDLNESEGHGQVKDDDYVPHDSDPDLPSPSTFLPARRPSAKPKTPTKLIDLTALSSDSSSTKIKLSRLNKTNKMPILHNAEPTAATEAEVASWDLSQLIADLDRHRLLIKLLANIGSERRDRLENCFRSSGIISFKSALHTAVQAHWSGSAQDGDMNDDGVRTMLEAALIYAKWMHPTENVPALKNESWGAIANNDDQINLFARMVGDIIRKNTAGMFPRHAPSASKKSSGAPIAISSSDEGEAVKKDKKTPHKKRKREVRRSQNAQITRELALNRQQRFNETQTTDPSRLVQMLASDPDHIEIEINPAKNDEDEAIYISTRIARKMKAHQIEGVQFLWREMTAEDGQGCVLAHTMGLGKTMQTLAFLIALNETARSKDERKSNQLPKCLRPRRVRDGRRYLRTLILCPPALVANWRREIDTWAEPGSIGPAFTIEANHAQTRLDILREWKLKGGVLLIGYGIFQRIVDTEKDVGPREDAATMEQYLLETPELVVADEAHQLKNPKSKSGAAVGRIQTESRIALTGTPMSNDVGEIYALVSWVAPGFLGDPKEFRAHYQEPIKEGLYTDSTAYEKRKSVMKLKVLQAEIEPKVNRASIEVLRGSLKPKVEFVITVSLTADQIELYKRYITTLRSGNRTEDAPQVTIFGYLAVLTLLTNHPYCFRQKFLAPPKPKKKDLDRGLQLNDEGDEMANVVKSGSATPLHAETNAATEQVQDDQSTAGMDDENALALNVSEANTILEGFEEDISPQLSAKVQIFLTLLDYSLECKEKILVFSSSIPTLAYLNQLLEHRGDRYGRLDRKVVAADRVKLLERFYNDEFDILLVSTRAGGVGLNCQIASRVFIFDFGFNPAHEEQAIGRAYRLGQTKPVFVYRFVAGGTFEDNIYNKQLFKSSLAKRVVDKKNPRRNAERKSKDYLYEPKEVRQQELAKEITKDPKVLGRLLSQHGPDEEGKIDTMIRAVQTMETLQEEAVDAPLDAQEQQEVDQEIQLSRNRVRGRKAGAVGSSVGTAAPPVNPNAVGPSRMVTLPAPRAYMQLPAHGSRPPPSTYAGPSAQTPDLHGHPLGGLPSTQPYERQ